MDSDQNASCGFEVLTAMNAREARRLHVLRGLEMLDKPREESLDAITRLCARCLGTPMCFLSLVDEDRQFLMSNSGLECTRETERDVAFCAHVLDRKEATFDTVELQVYNEHSDVMVVPDATRDGRFAKNRLVTGPPYLRFYAGVPIMVGDEDDPRREAIGTFCVLDTKERDDFDQGNVATLVAFGKLITMAIEQRRLSYVSARKMYRTFVAHTAHDMRTPVATFALVLDVLKASAVDPELATCLRQAECSVEVMTETIDRAISTQHRALKGLDAEVDRVDVRALLDRLALIADALYTSDVTFEAQVDIDVPRYVLTDGGLLWRSTLNLAQNALREATVHRAKHARVTARVSRRVEPVEDCDFVAFDKRRPAKEWLRVEVRDNGPGIAESIASSLFLTPVYKESNASGLGLLAVRDCVETLGGACGFKRDTPSAVFWLALPLLAPESLDSTPPIYPVSHTHRLPPRRRANVISPPYDTTDHPAPDTRRRTALVVEDSGPIRFMLTRLLEKRGFVVDQAVDGQAGLDKMTGASHDITILDFQMPRMGGIDCARQFRDWEVKDLLARLDSHIGTRRRRVIIGSSANAEPDDIARGLAAGLDLYVPKPITAAKLNTIMASLGVH